MGHNMSYSFVTSKVSLTKEVVFNEGGLSKGVPLSHLTAIIIYDHACMGSLSYVHFRINLLNQACFT